MSEEKVAAGSAAAEEADDLGALLDSSAKQFAPRAHTTDDELDDLMASADQQAAQKAASEFQQMLQQMVQVQEEAIRQNQSSEEVAAAGEGGAPLDDETQQMMDAMKQLLNCTGQVANASNEEEFMAGLSMLRSPDSNMEPFMSMIMESLVSKDVMYPPLKEIHTNYPKYLDDNRASLDAETLSRYEKQFEIIGQICEEFEKQPDTVAPVDGEVAAAAQPEEQTGEAAEAVPRDMSEFEKLGRLLMELQTYGYPPKELTGDLPEGWAVDEATGMPRVNDVSQAADACSIM